MNGPAADARKKGKSINLRLMMDRGRTRYQITEETEQSDGSVFVRVRKQYNDKADVSKYVNWHQTGLNLIRRVCDRNCRKNHYYLELLHAMLQTENLR